MTGGVEPDAHGVVARALHVDVADAIDPQYAAFTAQLHQLAATFDFDAMAAFLDTGDGT